jgi:hypothetical protein
MNELASGFVSDDCGDWGQSKWCAEKFDQMLWWKGIVLKCEERAISRNERRENWRNIIKKSGEEHFIDMSGLGGMWLLERQSVMNEFGVAGAENEVDLWGKWGLGGMIEWIGEPKLTMVAGILGADDWKFDWNKKKTFERVEIGPTKNTHPHSYISPKGPIKRLARQTKKREDKKWKKERGNWHKKEGKCHREPPHIPLPKIEEGCVWRGKSKIERDNG